MRAKVPWTWLLDDPTHAATVLTDADMSGADMVSRLAKLARRRGYDRDPRYVRLQRAMSDAALAEVARLKIERDIPITDADRRTFFADHPHRYDQFRLHHIFIGLHNTRTGVDRTEVQAASLARDIRAQLARGAAFEGLARTYSDDTATAALGGELSILMGAFMDKPFFDAVANALPGTTTDPVRGKDGFHIIHVDDRVNARADDVAYYIDQDIISERLPDAIIKAAAAE